MFMEEGEKNSMVLRRKVKRQAEKFGDAVKNDNDEKARAHAEEILILIGYYDREDV